MAFALLALVLTGIWLFCLFDILTTEEERIRILPKFGWFLIVLLGFLAGAAAWLLLGRDRRAPVPRPQLPPSPSEIPGGDGPSAPGGSPKGPDDDPAFMRDLERRLKGDDM